ncbi:class I adenylate-forming enzyme family protein, partial [Fibrobacterota bacterium]
MDAIDWIVNVQKRNRERVFLIDGWSGEEVTYRKLHERGCALAEFLIKRGLKKGDRVAIILNNSIDCAYIYFACLYCGIVTVPINPILTSREINLIVKSINPKLILLSKKTSSLIEHNEQRPYLIVDTNNDITDDEIQSREILNINTLQGGKGFQTFQGVTSDDTMTIVFTSGTTAIPKGVVHTIADLIDNSRLFCWLMGIGPKNKFYGILAMTYLGGYFNLLMLPYAAEASVVITKAFDATSSLDFWSCAKKYEVNTLWLVPTIMSILLEMDRSEVGEVFCRDQVKLALVGTAPLPREMKKRFETRYNINLYENYGLSETLFISTNPPKVNSQTDSVGKILIDIDVCVRDVSGNDLAYGQEGELFVKSPYTMKGYFKIEEKSIDKVSDQEWFPTGDMGVITDNGELYVTGRKKDLIIRGGINISPKVIEEALYEDPDVVTCAVVG